jgi:hypothetical protein
MEVNTDAYNSTMWAVDRSEISIAIQNSFFNTEMLSNNDNSAHLHKSLPHQIQNNWSSFIKEYPWSTIVQLQGLSHIQNFTTLSKCMKGSINTTKLKKSMKQNPTKLVSVNAIYLLGAIW